MYELTRLKLGQLDEELIHSYEPFAREENRCCLRGISPEGNQKALLVGIGAIDQNKPVGLALAILDKPYGHANILDLYVDPSHRNQHIGRDLLLTLQQESIKQGAGLFTYIYPLNEDYTPALEKMIASCGWTKARPFLIKCHFNVFNFNIPWVMKSTHTFPPGYSIFPWAELTRAERQDLERRGRENEFAYAVSPFANEAKITPLNSIGLRFQGRVVGWMICHQIAPDTIQYSALYVESTLKQHGLIMVTLLVDSMHRHLTARNHWAILEIPLIRVPRSWLNFIERRLVPFADKVTRFAEAWYSTRDKS